MYRPSSLGLEHCGCWYHSPSQQAPKVYLPQVDLKIHSTILATTSRTTLSQTFVNPTDKGIKDASYTFPLYDGVSIVSFKCEIGDRVIHGVVKEREQARTEYVAALSKGESAALLEQSVAASDTFTTSIGNVPAESKVVVHISYLGELQHDAQADGVRFTVPTAICPRYGQTAGVPKLQSHVSGQIEMTVDVKVENNSAIRRLHSPSHTLEVSLGRISTDPEDFYQANKASAIWKLPSQGSQRGSISLDKDFVLIVKAKDQEAPFAFLETHPNIANQRAIMASLVPKFTIPSNNPEVIFIIDRSGSMEDKIPTLRSALKVFLKSLPVGVKFNICSFGSTYSLMWKKSKTYDGSSLKEALEFADTVAADFGGTEMLAPVQASVENRFKDLDLDVLLLTDGEIWNQEELFTYINDAVSKHPVRFFSLGIGDAASHSLIQGIARAGEGFAQSVGTNEELDKKVVRMLKGALTPHIKNYTLEVEYEKEGDIHAENDDFEMAEKSDDHPSDPSPLSPVQEPMNVKSDPTSQKQQHTISLFDESFKETDIEVTKTLPTIPIPKILQAPYKIPGLFPFNRTNVYLLFTSENADRPKSVVLKGTSKHGPLSLKIPVEDVGENTTIHQLAARKITLDLEEGRGWVFHAKDPEGKIFVDQHESQKEDIAKREAVRLGIKYQIAGKWCSFVAVEGSQHDTVDLTSKEKVLSQPPQEQIVESYAASSFHPMGYMPHSTSGRSLFRSAPMASAPRGRMAKRCLPSYGGGSLQIRECSDRGRSSSSEGASLFGIAAPAASGNEFATSAAPAYNSASFSQPLVAPYMTCDLDSPGRSGFTGESTSGVESTLDPPYRELILRQAFDGSWEWKEETLKILGVSSDTLEKDVDWPRLLGIGQESIDKQDQNVRAMMITLAAVAYLNKKWQDYRETWELVTEKAMNWVNGKLATMGGKALPSQEMVVDYFQWDK
ncbi:hypothetical protein PRK78_004594 [Emydomyces testavorans]|uniref:von Willebrand domain-containing protein n=1 Tax=Emydomyces testavorans TaxID=2070801 RepID=A0AAF0IIR5_9EURO|nr:hypothetical protein PRK78_004594 [Emydomyces testavorans]